MRANLCAVPVNAAGHSRLSKCHLGQTLMENRHDIANSRLRAQEGLKPGSRQVSIAARHWAMVRQARGGRIKVGRRFVWARATP